MADTAEIIKLVYEGAKGVWAVIKEGKPVAAAQTAFCAVMPSKTQLAWEEVSGWKKKEKDWSFKMRSKLDALMGLDPTIDIDFHLEFQHGGKSSKAKGLFLQNYSVWCTRCDVDWGWTVNVNASTTGTPGNLGSEEAPIGSILLKVILDYSSPLVSRNKTWSYTAGADGSLS